MNALSRFLKHGAIDADRRVAAILTPPSIGNADRYLMSSVVVRAIDRWTVGLHAMLLRSQLFRVVSGARGSWHRTTWPERYRMIGVVLITAVGVHLTATLINDQSPAWARLIVPTLVAAFAIVVLVASRSRSTRI